MSGTHPVLSLAVDNDGYPLLLAAVYDVNAEGGNPWHLSRLGDGPVH